MMFYLVDDFAVVSKQGAQSYRQVQGELWEEKEKKVRNGHEWMVKAMDEARKAVEGDEMGEDCHRRPLQQALPMT